MKNYIHQHDINGCGIATIANLLQTTYEEVKQEFETKFYPITRGVKVTDITRFLKLKGLDYMVKHINEKKVSDSDGVEMAKELNSIVLIRRNAKYPIGHYLLRVKDGWIDPWLNLPSINQVHAGLRNELPNPPMYIISKVK